MALMLYGTQPDYTLDVGSTYTHPGERPRVERYVEPRTGIVGRAGDQVPELGNLVVNIRVAGVNRADTLTRLNTAIVAARGAYRFYDGIGYLNLDRYPQIGEPRLILGLTGLVTVTFAMLDPYWHLSHNDGSKRLTPYS